MSDDNHQHLDEYGPVFVLGGEHKGRIGYYDNDEYEGAVVYFGSMLLCQNFHLITYKLLRPANTRDLLNRSEIIYNEIHLKISDKKRCDILLEKNYIDGELYGNYYKVRYGNSKKIKNKRIFISHSSKDKPFAKTLATDLSNFGIRPWISRRTYRSFRCNS